MNDDIILNEIDIDRQTSKSDAIKDTKDQNTYTDLLDIIQNDMQALDSCSPASDLRKLSPKEINKKDGEVYEVNATSKESEDGFLKVRGRKIIKSTLKQKCLIQQPIILKRKVV